MGFTDLYSINHNFEKLFIMILESVWIGEMPEFLKIITREMRMCETVD